MCKAEVAFFIARAFINVSKRTKNEHKRTKVHLMSYVIHGQITLKLKVKTWASFSISIMYIRMYVCRYVHMLL